MRALEIDPRNAAAHYNLGRLEDEAGNREQALRTIARSFNTAPLRIRRWWQKCEYDALGK